MEITVRLAMVDDVPLITRIGYDTFYETWKDVNTPEDMDVYLKKSFNDNVILSDVLNPTNTFFIGFADNIPAGYVKIRRDRTYDELNGESAIEIERIYVYNDFHSKKVGKHLMDESIRISKEEGYKWLWLGVNVDNHKAINFYKKYGFEIFGEKNFQLGEAVDMDYLMKKKLKD